MLEKRKRTEDEGGRKEGRKRGHRKKEEQRKGKSKMVRVFM